MADPKRVAAGKKSKRKGSGNERALAKAFQAWWGHGEWARTPASGGWATAATREAFRTCGDIITTANDFPFCVEAKKCEGWTLDQMLHNDKCIIYKWWDQVVNETPPGLIPLLVAARNHHPPIAIFDEKHVAAMMATVGAFAKSGEPLFPWCVGPYFYFDRLVPLEEPVLTIVSLENFFTTKPEYFGRKLPNVEHGDNTAGASSTNGAPQRT